MDEQEQNEQEQAKELVKSMINIFLDILGDQAMAQKIAKAAKTMFDALVKEGFTKQEALQILLSMNNQQKK